jgi:hypothetical protein
MIRASLLLAALAAAPCLRAWGENSPPSAAPAPPINATELERIGTSKSVTIPTGPGSVSNVSLSPQSEPAAGAESPESVTAVGQATPGQAASTACGDCKPIWHPVKLPCDDCAPDICRFDHCWDDWPCCVTETYCPHPCKDCYHGTSRQSGQGDGWISDSLYCDVYGESDDVARSVARFGWWAVSSDGSKQRTGEFQDLESSPFWDFDTIRSDGTKTFDITASGLDNEANDAHLGVYGPRGSAKVDFQRFLRRVDHDPLFGADRRGPLGPADNVVTEDLNVGEDYAIRVQQLDARFQGKLSENIKVRLNVWEQRKFGERMSNATAHCFDVDPGAATNNVCHVLSQRQRVDWTTVEIQPVVEVQFDAVTIEYSRTMREFSQSDGVVTRQYTRFAPFNGPGNTLGPPFEYAVVPESFTQIDRVKVGACLSEDSDLYANLYYGDTENLFRDLNRQFSGYDVRLINRSFDGVTIIPFASLDEENNEFPPPFLLPEELNTGVNNQLRHPIDYSRARAGVRGNWQPFSDDCSDRGLAWRSLLWTAGYEYTYLARDFASYQTDLGPFTQPDTITNQVDVGPSIRWSPTLENYVRYKVRFIENPLIGVREANGRLNTNLPEEVHWIDIGGTWTPDPTFMASAQFSVMNSWHDSEFADFTEQNYPFFLTLWYSPTQRWSVTGGYGFYSNAIDQDITLGFFHDAAGQTETTRWDYDGEYHVFSLNGTYCLTPAVQLVAGYEWVSGTNVFTVPPSPAGANWSALPSFSDIDVDTQRFTAGMDWRAYRDMSLYFRYIFFDYNDVASGFEDGSTHMALAGTDYIW